MSLLNTPEWIRERSEVLASSGDRQTLAATALEMAAADDPGALDALAGFLRDPGFLARLDDLETPHAKTANLFQVFDKFLQIPTPETASACLACLRDGNFMADPDRKIFVLEALAAAPITAESAEAFRQANGEGYYMTSARLLAANGSPAAMALLLAMMTDESVRAERRADALHTALIPVRNRIPVMEFTGRLASRAPDPAVVAAAVESIFDFNREWRAGHPPPPPPWRTASVETLQYAVTLAGYLKSNFSLPPTLVEAIDRTAGMCAALLARRRG